MVRGKFRLIIQSETANYPSARALEFFAVCDDKTEENRKYALYTPSGEIKMTVNNPAALEQFELGKEYYVDFTPAEE